MIQREARDELKRKFGEFDIECVDVLIGKPGIQETSDPFVPFLVVGGAFGFAIVAMLMPLLSEFDIALGRATGGNE